jgi:RNA polymerase sigma-70 factor (ECF subfamily)
LVNQPTETIEALIAQARGRRETLGDLLERYRPFLLLISHNQIDPKVAARCSPSDIVQETFAEACRGFDRFTGSTEAEFSVWLRTIHEHNLCDAARRHLIAQGRAAGREQRLRGPEEGASITWRDVPASEQSPSDWAIEGERALRLASLLLSLPEGQREAIRMRHLEGCTVAEIAQRMERSLPAVAGLLKRGLLALERKMSEDSWF